MKNARFADNSKKNTLEEESVDVTNDVPLDLAIAVENLVIDGAHSVNNNSTAVVNQMMPNEDLQFLKSCIVNDENMEGIKAVLKRTFDIRKELSKDRSVVFALKFPYAFTHPRVVRFDI